MKPRLNYISSGFALLCCAMLCCLSLACVVMAQDVPEDSTNLVTPALDELRIDSLSSASMAVRDSIEPKMIYPFFSEASVLYDYGKTLGYLTGVEKKNELGVQIRFKKALLLCAEAGYSSLTPNKSYANADYQVRGSYFRAGLGLQKAITPKEHINVGFRYGLASFEDEGTVQVSSTSGLFEPYRATFTRTGMTASWFELVMGSEGRIRTRDQSRDARLYLGFFFRLRVMNGYDRQSPHDVFAIPGYGRTFDMTVPAINLYIRCVLASNKPAAGS